MFSTRKNFDKDLLATISRITKINETPDLRAVRNAIKQETRVSPQNVVQGAKAVGAAGAVGVPAAVGTAIGAEKAGKALGMDPDVARDTGEALGAVAGGAAGTHAVRAAGFQVPHATVSGVGGGAAGLLGHHASEKAMDAAGVKDPDARFISSMMSSNVAGGLVGSGLAGTGWAAGALGGAAAGAGSLLGWYGARGILNATDALTGSDLAQQETNPFAIHADYDIQGRTKAERDAEEKKAEEERKTREASPEGQQTKQELKDILKAGDQYDRENPPQPVTTTTQSEVAPKDAEAENERQWEQERERRRNEIRDAGAAATQTESRFYDASDRILAINECLFRLFS